MLTHPDTKIKLQELCMRDDIDIKIKLYDVYMRDEMYVAFVFLRLSCFT